MFRKALRKIIPTYAILPLLLTGISLVMSFGLAKLIQMIFPFEYIDLTIGADQYFPFNPGWVLVYVETFIFWLLAYTTIARENAQRACYLAAADMVNKFLCLLIFLFLPTTNVRPEFEVDGLFTFGMNIVYFLDTPTNLFPSMHCSIAWMAARLLLSSKHLKHRPTTCICAFGFSVLVFLSTLFTKQHVILDVFGGVLVAELGLLAAHFTKLPKVIERANERFLKTKLSTWL